MVGESTQIYHKIVFYASTIWYFFEKIKKSLGLWSPGSKVSNLIPADLSGLTVWSINIDIYKIDTPTLNSFNRVQVEDKLKRGLFIYK